jgi:predicted ATPase/signal transduction histidine kinase/serine/threonine protein kinase
MLNLGGYQIFNKIYASNRTLVYRGIREQDQKPVVIKVLRNEYPTFNQLVQFRHQYTISKNLNLPGVITTYSLENYRNGYALIMEDFGGVSLVEEMKRWGDGGMGGNPDSLKEFCYIAKAIVSTLEGLYHNRIIHKDIKPANILINPTSREVKFIDFSIASLLPRETQVLTNPNVLEGSLAYLSPEQTGRMNRGIDYRTDYYSLGVTFYQLLTRRLPFTTTNAMELVYCHIAQQPPCVHTINSEVPPTLSNIVNKLMAKNAEERYQSALGIKHDIERCLEQLQLSGKIDDFELATRDVCDRFIISEKLYGREREVTTLLAAFDRVSGREIEKCTTEMVLVAGFSGIGKTALVNEVHKPIVRASGYYCKGKFDQFQRDIPLSAFVQAFQDLISQLLVESDVEIEQWKTKILAALGEQAQVIINVIPELERIIGKQPPVPELTTSSAQNRFNQLFEKFIQVFTSVSHPLVIFLDDLQWADSASLKLMQLLMSETSTSHLLLIGAYRDNEVFPAHPLMLALDKIRKKLVTISTIVLAPLTLFDLNALIADTLSCPPKLAVELTELVYPKTQGNPFFTTQLLKSLYDEKILSFNYNYGHWECDITQVKALALTDDIVSFLALKLQKLPISTQKVLYLAACIGNQFNLNALALVHEKSLAQTAADLWKALEEGFILPLSEIYKFFQDETTHTQLCSTNLDKPLSISLEELVINYKFLHDRVQQAAYSLIPEAEKPKTHLKIGKLLLSNTSDEEVDEKIFEIVNQLNLGRKLISSSDDKNQLASLNLIAGCKAKSSIAYEAALKYLNTGLELLTENSWENQYELTLSLYIELVSVSYFIGDFEGSHQLIEIVLQKAKALIDKVKVYEVKIQTFMAQSKHLEAMKTGLVFLKLLGVSFPKNPSESDIQIALAETQSRLTVMPIENLIDLPEMTEPYKLAAIKVLSAIFSAAHQAVPAMLPLIICQQINLSIQYGNTSDSAFAYANYGLILCNSGDIDSGYQIAQIAEKIVKKFNVKELKGRILLNVITMTRHWKEHVRQTLLPLLEAYSNGLETQDCEFASYSAVTYCLYSYFAGKELQELAHEISHYSQAILKLNQERIFYWNELFRQVVLNLLGSAENPCDFTGEAYNENFRLPLHIEANERLIICHYYIHKMFFYNLFYQPKKARESALLAQQYLDGIAGILSIPIFYFYDSLILLSLFRSGENSQQQSALEQVNANQEKMKHWAHHAPMNYLHKFYLVEAERYRCQGSYLEAMEMYDDAIAKAKENQYIQEEALANEQAAQFYIEWGKEKIAQTYLIDAYYGYARWGAYAKIQDLEKRYADLLAPIVHSEKSCVSGTDTALTSAPPSLSIHNTIHSEVTNSTTISNTLDLASVIQASLVLSSEIELDKLLCTIMEVVVKNAGANLGCFILMKHEKLEVAAQCFSNEKCSLFSVPLGNVDELPVKVINYVKNTLETVVIDDALADYRFGSDSYIVEKQPKSVLSTPIIYKNKLLGIIYLENTLTTKAFTSARVQLLNLLGSQIAISLENAILYRSLQHSEAREREKATQLEQSLHSLQQAQLQLVQSEKMSTLGNLVTGIAHEINNPVNFIDGNLDHAEEYIVDLLNLLYLYQQRFPNPGTEIEKQIKQIDLDFLKEDLPELILSMKEGTERIRNISTSLRTFSRADTSEKVRFNIHDGIDSTLMILKHRLKANAQRSSIDIIKDYGELPSLYCYPGQLNQVFMNLFANAIDAIDEMSHNGDLINPKSYHFQIRITTEFLEQLNIVNIYIQDNGIGMSEEVKEQVFDHLFTTKPVGKGTGLGLSISRQIVEEKHNGKLTFTSHLGKGTKFAIQIPILARVKPSHFTD